MAEVTWEESAAVIHMPEIYGMATLKTVKETLYELVEKGSEKIIADFTNTHLIDSSGIGELVSSYVSVKNAGGKLRIARVPEKIMLILEYTSLGNIIEVFDNEAAALEDFG